MLKMYYKRPRREKYTAMIVVFFWVGVYCGRWLAPAVVLSPEVMEALSWQRAGFFALPLADAGWRVLKAVVSSRSGYQRSFCDLIDLLVNWRWYLFYVLVFCVPSSLCEVNLAAEFRWCVKVNRAVDSRTAGRQLVKRSSNHFRKSILSNGSFQRTGSKSDSVFHYVTSVACFKCSFNEVSLILIYNIIIMAK